MKVTTQRFAFLGKDTRITPDQLHTEAGAKEMSFFASREGWERYGYTYVGEVEAVVDIPELRELVENKIASLREEAASMRAEVTAKCTEIESQIQNLLAIEYTPA